jgi:NADH:ubiquinone oxidoreductase subunit 6 (subunit J)
MTLDILILVVLIVAALATVMTAQLIRSVIGLALTSALVSLVLFRMHAPLAGVFELSVGAGLIPAIFLSVIGMTKRLTPDALTQRRKEKLRLYWALPILVIVVGAVLTQVHLPNPPAPPPGPFAADVKTIFWNLRHVDIVGQILILLGGAFGVVVLVKEIES